MYGRTKLLSEHPRDIDRGVRQQLWDQYFKHVYLIEFLNCNDFCQIAQFIQTKEVYFSNYSFTFVIVKVEHT